MSRPLKLRLTEAAEDDLVEIWSYLAEEASETIATRFVLDIQQRFDHVANWPRAGARREQLGPRLRVVFHRAYAIYYSTNEDQAVIVRVLQGARDIESLQSRGGFDELP